MVEPHSIELLPDEAFGWYLTGLTDGEGCFQFRLEPDPRQPTWRHWRSEFSIAMREDERPHLEAVVRRVGCGRLYLAKRRKPVGNDKPAVRWQVAEAESLASVIVPHFDRFPLQFKKAADFVIWRKAIMLFAEGMRRKRFHRGNRGAHSRFSEEEHVYFASLADQLQTGRRYKATPAVVPPPPTPPGGDQPMLPWGE